MIQKSKGLLLKGPKQVELVEEDIKSPREGQVLIRIDNVSLCGSDLRIYEGTYSGPMKYPLFVGHEWAGKIETVGRGVNDLKPGEHVTGDCSLWCGTCSYCLEDKNLCEKIEKVGMTRDGASRQFFLQEAKYVYPAGQLDLQALSLAEPLSVVCHAASAGERMVGPLSGRRILIFGGGNMGMALLMVLQKIFGCSSIDLYDPIPFRMKKAIELGATPPSDIDFITRKKAATGGGYSSFYPNEAYDLIFESTGSKEAFSAALEVVKPLGGIVAIGFVPPSEVNLRLITLKAIKLVGTIGGTGEFPKVLKALEKDPLYFKGLITHRYHFSEYSDAFKTAMEKEGALKVQIYCGDR
jgi:2-desacetyl-2-hydroxyethyl bacteriochlorophyllide A dehydrogenase